MVNEILEQQFNGFKRVIPLKDGGTLEIRYDPKTEKAVEAIKRNRQGQILEYTNLKELEELEEKVANLKQLGLKNPEKYVSFSA